MRSHRIVIPGGLLLGWLLLVWRPSLVEAQTKVDDVAAPKGELLEAIRDGKDWTARYEAAIDLSIHADFAVEDVLELFESKDQSVRSLAVHALSNGGERAASILRDRLDSDPHPFVQSACAVVLGRIRDTCSVPRLIELVSDEKTNDRVRRLTIEALGEMRNARASKPLVEVLTAELAKEPMGEYADEAIMSLAKIGDAEAVRTLVSVAACQLHVSERQALYAYESHKALWRLHTINNPDGLTELYRAASGASESMAQLDPSSKHRLWIVEQAILGMGNVKTDQASELLAQLLREHPSKAAATAAGKTERPQAAVALLETIENDQLPDEFRWSATRALRRMPTEIVTPAVLATWTNHTVASSILTDFYLASSIDCHGDSRLLPVWRNLFERTAPKARQGRWGTRKAEYWERTMFAVFEGLKNLGPAARPLLEEWRDDPQNANLLPQLHRFVEPTNRN